MAKQTVIGNYYQVLSVDDDASDHQQPEAQPNYVQAEAPVCAPVEVPPPPPAEAQLNNNLPREIPHFTQYSLNLKGIVADKIVDNKMAWSKHTFFRKKIGAVHMLYTSRKHILKIKQRHVTHSAD